MFVCARTPFGIFKQNTTRPLDPLPYRSLRDSWRAPALIVCFYYLDQRDGERSVSHSRPFARSITDRGWEFEGSQGAIRVRAEHGVARRYRDRPLYRTPRANIKGVTDARTVDRLARILRHSIVRSIKLVVQPLRFLSENHGRTRRPRKTLLIEPRVSHKLRNARHTVAGGSREKKRRYGDYDCTDRCSRNVFISRSVDSVTTRVRRII